MRATSGLDPADPVEARDRHGRDRGHGRGRSRGVAVGAAVLSLGLLAGACSGDEGAGAEADDAEAASSETPSEGPSATTAAGDEEGGSAPTLTAPGSQLAFGDTATVEYTAQGDTATLDLTVRSAEKGALEDFSGFDTQDPLVRNANFYYVRVRVENVGKRPFGNAEVPLWGISGEDRLLPPVNFRADFQTCPTETLPARFRPGDTFATCLVFLSPDAGSLEGVSYRPTVEFTPIEWRGKVEGTGGKQEKKKRDRDGD